MTAGPTLRDQPKAPEEAVEGVPASDVIDEPALEVDEEAPVETVERPRERTRRWLSWLFRRKGDGEPRETEPTTFSDLVRAHRAWEQDLYEHERYKREPPDRADEREEFVRKWRLFEAKYGRIDDAYWSVRDASAVALTVKHKTRRFRRDPELVPRFHRATDWATRDEPDIAGVLDECETLAVRVEEILRGPSELIALRNIHAVACHLLGFVDREWFRQPPTTVEDRAHDDKGGKGDRERKEFVKRQRAELERIERFYRRTGNGLARILYFWGMVYGLIAGVVLTAIAASLIPFVDWLDGGAVHSEGVELLVISIMAGAFGAILSVLTRMASPSGKFVVDHELGRKNVRWTGIFRPMVGGIFGLATYLMLASGILQTEGPTGEGKVAYYGILALFSGFFERFTKLGAGGVPAPLSEDSQRRDGG